MNMQGYMKGILEKEMWIVLDAKPDAKLVYGLSLKLLKRIRKELKKGH